MPDSRHNASLAIELENFLAHIATTAFDGDEAQAVLANLLTTAEKGIRQIGGPTSAMTESLKQITLNNPAHQETLRALTDGVSESWLANIDLLDISCLPEGACIPGNPVDLAQMLAPEIPFVAPPQPPAIPQDEGKPLQAVLPGEKNGGCEWSTGKLSGFFRQHCSAALATPEERAALRREFGYGSLPDNKPSLFRTQPYCPAHLRRSIQPSRKAQID
ncbi:MAG: hypothetical protein HYS17_00180 [Micavibrio aeruginosavorus]|uniref:Uncharacterized protein n=1 Tax=Micavibrio aeruginosavorus TaxID=349221 RepID=A0A7T5UHR1_9BACT|nr:MAG: hypothetical protein HYS17_00180 [Micavibrio aeruginosavorus]